MELEIKTDRLYLRKYKENDNENLHKLKTEPKVWQYSTKPLSQSLNDTKSILMDILSDYVNNQTNYYALLTIRENQYIGEAGVISYNKLINEL